MDHNSGIQVPRVNLGSQGLEVSRLGFGCGSLSGILNAPLSHEAGGVILREACDIYGKDVHREQTNSDMSCVEYARQCIEASLGRLDVDYIDLYYQHRVDKIRGNRGNGE